jgi:hypothetical protein
VTATSSNNDEVAGQTRAGVLSDATRSASDHRLPRAMASVALVEAIVAAVVGLFFGLRSNVLYVESMGHVDCG